MTDRTKEQLILNLIVAVIILLSFAVVSYASYERGWCKGYQEARIDASVGRVSK